MSQVLYEQAGHVGVITMNRPEALNALSTDMLRDLDACLEAVDLKTVRCLIITGAGKAFVAGADVKEMMGFHEDQAFDFSTRGNRVFRRIETFPVPVIAAINGFALGGGCELAMCCDLRIASEKASFGQPEAGLGITPGFGGTQRMPRLVGAEKAKELIFTCRRIKAQEALQIGLVGTVCPPEELMEKAMSMAEEISKNVPFAIRACKSAINEGEQGNMDVALGIEAERFADCFSTEDRMQAMTAFVEKRPAEPFQNK